jgi:uncharacterized protein YecE (DUF72 family)
MRLHAGTSGYSYAEWRGTFYPEAMPAAQMLAFYAARFDTVEINNTFYRMPKAPMLETWAAQVPESFLFALKAPAWITNRKSLDGVGRDAAHFCEVASTLGARLGPLMFRLPRMDAAHVRELVDALPAGPRVAVDIPDPSWCDDEVYAILRERDVAVCIADTDEVADPAALLVPTASWGYLRLRRASYSRKMLKEWRARIEAQAWKEAFVFFKHEDEGKGTRFAGEILGLGSRA